MNERLTIILISLWFGLCPVQIWGSQVVTPNKQEIVYREHIHSNTNLNQQYSNGKNTIVYIQSDLLTAATHLAKDTFKTITDSTTKIASQTNPIQRRKQKTIAVILAITLGVFGAHRLYLGTATRIPIMYTLTLGGGFGLLVVSDIIAILTTKNMDDYTYNSRMFMWTK